MSCGYEGSVDIIYKDGVEEWAGWSYSDRFYTGALVGDHVKEILKEISSGTELMDFIEEMYYQHAKETMKDYGRDVDRSEVIVAWHCKDKLLKLNDFTKIEKIKLKESCEDYSGYGGGGSVSRTLSNRTNKYIKK